MLRKVPETALDQCPDLLEEYTDLLKSGWREDGKIHSDSGSEDDDQDKKKASDDSDAYSENENPGNKSDADSEGDMDVDTSDEGTHLSSEDIPLQQQASRRSNREAAQKKVDYSKQAEYNEEDDAMSEETEDSSDEATSSVDVPLSKQRRRASSDSDFEVVSRPSHQPKQRPQASSTDVKSVGDAGSDEEFVEGGIQEKDLRPEQFHSPVSVYVYFMAHICYLTAGNARIVRNAKLLRLGAFFPSILGKRNGSGKSRTKRVTGTQAQSKLTAGKQADLQLHRH